MGHHRIDDSLNPVLLTSAPVFSSLIYFFIEVQLTHGIALVSGVQIHCITYILEESEPGHSGPGFQGKFGSGR